MISKHWWCAQVARWGQPTFQDCGHRKKGILIFPYTSKCVCAVIFFVFLFCSSHNWQQLLDDFWAIIRISICHCLCVLWIQKKISFFHIYSNKSIWQMTKNQEKSEREKKTSSVYGEWRWFVSKCVEQILRKRSKKGRPRWIKLDFEMLKSNQWPQNTLGYLPFGTYGVRRRPQLTGLEEGY